MKECVNGTYFCEDNGMFYNPDTPQVCFNLTHELDFIDVTYRAPAAEEHWYYKARHHQKLLIPGHHYILSP